MSIENPTIAHFRHFIRRGGFSSLFPNLPSTSVEIALQISPFYAKQTQFTKCPGEHIYLYHNDLCNFNCLMKVKNKANSKPIQTQTKPIKAKYKAWQSQFKPKTKPMPPAISAPATLMIDDCLHPAYNDNGHYRKDL